MKRFFYVILSVFLALIISQNAAAQGDTLVIFSTPQTAANSLDVVVAADQAGANHHLVYKLVSADTPYVFSATVVVDNSVEFIGVPGSNGKLPCIQPNVLADATVPGHLFTFTKNSSSVKIKNLYLLGISINNSVNWGDGMAVSVTGNDIKTQIDNVVFEQWGQFGINFSGQNDGFWVTNCKFRNFVNTGSVYTGEAFRMRNDLGVTLVDTIVIKYNTFLAVNAYACAAPVAGYSKYVDFSHNTIVGMMKNPFFMMNVTNWKCEHNIFYANYTGGLANGEYPYWDRVWTPGVGAIIDLDTLNILNAARMGIDTTKATWKAQAEAGRKIEINDNIYFMPQAVKDFYTTWNSTHTGTDSIVTTDWMNDITSHMFADHSYWPGLHAEGNLVTDPGYGASLAGMIGASGTTVPAENGVGLIPYLAAARGNGGVAGVIWGYSISAPDYSSGNWAPAWPLPEKASGVLKYSASLTATDGKPYGDPYWFTGTPTGVKEANTTPLSYKLDQNYPNPFNPSTTINFSIPEAGNISLKIYDVMGREVMTVINNTFTNPGAHNFKVDLSNLSSGVYFYSLEYSGKTLSKKMMLLK